MIAATSPQLGTCPEYQLLLEKCQKALMSWQQRRTIVAHASLAGKNAAAELRRLQENYARAHALLDGHEHSCRTCQYISKIAGLDFDSMSMALNEYRRPE
jgi:calcineurin-like phosphoesterase family protein